MKQPTPKTIAKSARVPPVPTKDDIQEDSLGKKWADGGEKLATIEAEKARAGAVGRFTGWGESARGNAVFILLISIIGILAVALFSIPDVEIKRSVVDLLQILGGALAGYYVADKRK